MTPRDSYGLALSGRPVFKSWRIDSAYPKEPTFHVMEPDSPALQNGAPEARCCCAQGPMVLRAAP